MEKLIKEYIQKPINELCDIVDTGVFNGIIKAYVLMTCNELNQDKTQALNIINGLLDNLTASEVLSIYKKG